MSVEAAPKPPASGERRIAHQLTDLRVILVLAVVGVTLVASVFWHWAENRVTLSLVSQALELEPFRNVELRPERGSGTVHGDFEISEAATIGGLPAGLSTNNVGRVSVLGEGSVALRALYLAPGGALRLETVDGPAFDLQLHGSGRVELQTSVSPSSVAGISTLRLELGGANGNVSTEVAEPLSLVAQAASGAVPLHVVLPQPVDKNAPPLELRETIPVKVLRFAFRQNRGDTGLEFRSGIVEGTLRLRDTGRDYKLSAYEPLRLDGLRGVVSYLAIGQNGIHVNFTGTVRDVRIGSQGFDEDLSPTLLQYFLGQETWKVLSGVVVAVTGAMWGIRQWARAHEG